MKKYWYRTKHWLFIRRYRLEDIKFESDGKGNVDVFVCANDKQERITTIRHLEGTSERVTDYGIAIAVKRCAV